MPGITRWGEGVPTVLVLMTKLTRWLIVDDDPPASVAGASSLPDAPTTSPLGDLLLMEA